MRTKITLIARWRTDLLPRSPEFNVERIDAPPAHVAKMSVYFETATHSPLELNIEFGRAGASSDTAWFFAMSVIFVRTGPYFRQVASYVSMYQREHLLRLNC